MTEVLALVLAAVIGCLSIRLLGPARGLRPKWATVVLEVSLGLGAGAALTAILFFALLSLGVAGRAVVFGLELVILAVLAFFNWKMPAAAVPPAPPAETGAVVGWRWNSLPAVILCLAMLLTVAAQIDAARANPNGEFDAFAMWNVRAKFLLGHGDTWQRAFSPLLERQRPDHPLLLSTFVARTWRLGGDAATGAAPFGASVLFYYGSVGILFSALALFRGLSTALLAGLVLVANNAFQAQSTWQYADIPIALFITGSIVLLLLSATAEGRRKTVTLMLSGAFASFAAMTKNEGIPFLLLMLAAYLIVRARTAGLGAALCGARLWLAGALPGAFLQAGFKLFLAPSGGPFAGPSMSQAIDFLGQWDRYVTVGSALVEKAVAMGSGLSHPIVLLVILVAVLRLEFDPKLRPYLVIIGAVLGFQLLSYCGVYLTTLDDIGWRLDTSLARLYSQLWPALVLLMFLIMRTPRDEAVPAEAETRKPEEKKRRKRGKKG